MSSSVISGYFSRNSAIFFGVVTPRLNGSAAFLASFAACASRCGCKPHSGQPQEELRIELGSLENTPCVGQIRVTGVVELS